MIFALFDVVVWCLLTLIVVLVFMKVGNWLLKCVDIVVNEYKDCRKVNKEFKEWQSHFYNKK